MEHFGLVLTGHRFFGGAVLNLSVLHPLSEALPVVMQVDVPTTAIGEVDFWNEGDSRFSKSKT